MHAGACVLWLAGVACLACMACMRKPACRLQQAQAGAGGRPARCRLPPTCLTRTKNRVLQAGPYVLSDSEDEERRAFQEGLAASALGQEWSFGPGADPEASTGGCGTGGTLCIMGLGWAALPCLAQQVASL